MNREELKKEAQEQVNYCTPLYPESFIQGYLAGAEPRENKIADIKANCDLAIEGRDIKIKELELELTVEKDLLQEEINLHLHAEDYIKSLEQKLEQTEKDLADYQFNYPKIKELEKEAEEINITYENNVFHCTKNGTKWISIDGEKWYGEEKRIAELEAQIEKMKNWCNCKNYQQCLIELAEQGKGMYPSECCRNCKKWEIEK